MTKIFLSTQFTRLHHKTLISVGMATEAGEDFYFECTDYDKSQVDDWLQENVIKYLLLGDSKIGKVDEPPEAKSHYFKGDKSYLSSELKKWLSEFEQVEIWSDVLAYNWVLFSQIFGHTSGIPGNVYHIPFDIATMFKLGGVDPGISREKFAGYHTGINGDLPKRYNALWDARIIKDCYDKMMLST